MGVGTGGTVIIVPRPIPMNEVPKGPPLVALMTLSPENSSPAGTLKLK